MGVKDSNSKSDCNGVIGWRPFQRVLLNGTVKQCYVIKHAEKVASVLSCPYNKPKRILTDRLIDRM